MNMIKDLWCIFQERLGTFTILLVEASSETGVLRHLSDYFFGVRNFGIAKALRVIFSVKISKLNLDFKNAAKSWENLFCFLDNCIWIRMVKLSIWRRRYFWSPANVLTSNPKILHVNKRDFFELNFVAVIDEDDKGAVMQISTVLVHVSHVACRSILWNRTF